MLSAAAASWCAPDYCPRAASWRADAGWTAARRKFAFEQHFTGSILIVGRKLCLRLHRIEQGCDSDSSQC